MSMGVEYYLVVPKWKLAILTRYNEDFGYDEENYTKYKNIIENCEV